MEKTVKEKTNTIVTTVEETELVAPADFTDPEELYRQLKKIIWGYHKSADLSMIEKAYHIANNAHKNQRRKSGEPYIIHPLCVCIILAELELDKETIVAGMLHDVVEDTVLTMEEITEEFSEEIALLVDGVTKLTQISYVTDKVEVQAENLRKMFLAMAKDIRVVLIKLADRLHNMRTMQYQTTVKQMEKSRETMDIYAPIAQRLGISKVKIELDDLSLKYLEADVYKDLTERIAFNKKDREAFIDDIIKNVAFHMEQVGIEAKIDGRVKHFFSIYKKMVNQNKTLDQVYDIFAIRILVKNLQDCYGVLGVIHDMYKPIMGRFKDYISVPKQNMYQSLHTTVIGSNGQPFEIQIRTYEMHRIAEYGIAAHWKYKEGVDGKNTQDNEEAKLTWLRQILEWQRDMSDNKEFLSLLKSDLNLFGDFVYCFTPSGEVKNLPKGSTTIDFAYSIHSAVGNRMVGARVNGKMIPIDYVIENGDRIEIITSQNSRGPSLDWLALVKSTQAKNKINQWFKTELKDENIIKGKEMLISYCKSKNLVLSDLLKTEFTDKFMMKYGFRDWESVYAAVGHGGLKEGQVINKLLSEDKKRNREDITDKQVLETLRQEGRRESTIKSKSGIVVRGVDDIAVRFSKCCSPVPGDEIIGFVTRGRGISVHRTDCVNVMSLPEEDRKRLMEAEWDISISKAVPVKYMVEIKIYAENRDGLLADISKTLTENKIGVDSMTVRTSKQGIATMIIGFEIKSVEQLQGVIKKLLNIPSILDVERSNS